MLSGSQWKWCWYHLGWQKLYVSMSVFRGITGSQGVPARNTVFPTLFSEVPETSALNLMSFSSIGPHMRQDWCLCVSSLMSVDKHANCVHWFSLIKTASYLVEKLFLVISWWTDSLSCWLLANHHLKLFQLLMCYLELLFIQSLVNHYSSINFSFRLMDNKIKFHFLIKLMSLTELKTWSLCL